MKKVFALVDCNSFYVSCERVFRPDLNGKAVGVLSGITERKREIQTGLEETDEHASQVPSLL